MVFTLKDKIFRKLGYSRTHIVRTIVCPWCGKSFTWEGEARNNPPVFCGETHRKKSQSARQKRLQAIQVATENQKKKPEPVKPNPVPKDPEPVKVEEPKWEPENLNMIGRCPTPFKQIHATFESAREVVARVDPTMHPYRCVCGGIHIGHWKNSKKKKRR